MNRSDYTYEFHEFSVDPKFTGSDKERVLVITGLNLGNKSVTNDIENVIADIMAEEPFNAFVPVAYYDSEGDLMLVSILALDPVEVAFLPGVYDMLDEALEQSITRWKWQSQNNAYAIRYGTQSRVQIKNQIDLLNLITPKP